MKLWLYCNSLYEMHALVGEVVLFVLLAYQLGSKGCNIGPGSNACHAQLACHVNGTVAFQSFHDLQRDKFLRAAKSFEIRVEKV